MAVEPSPSFLQSDFHYVPTRDLRLQSVSLFEHLTDINLRNPMTSTSDVESPSFKDIILDLLSSKHSWYDAISKQKMITTSNIEYLATLTEINSRKLSDYIRIGTLTDEIHLRFNDCIQTICRKSLSETNHLKTIKRFIEENSDILTIREGDADEPLDIFQVRLPVWFRNSSGTEYIKWISLYTVLTEILFNESNKASPSIPSLDSFSCTHYLMKLFNSSTITNHTRTTHIVGSRTSLQSILLNVQSKIKMGRHPIEPSLDYGIYLRNRRGNQYSGIGKTRYTLSVILRWIDLTHKLLFRDQISHSIAYHFYRNIRTVPITILTGGTEKRYVNALLRTITKDTMPDEEDDPVLLVPFEEGQDVYKMRCCRKDIMKDTILGIIQSGRTPKCPMCRSRLFTTDQKCPIDPTYTEPEEIQIVENSPSYVTNPIIPSSSYMRNPLGLE